MSIFNREVSVAQVHRDELLESRLHTYRLDLAEWFSSLCHTLSCCLIRLTPAALFGSSFTEENLIEQLRKLRTSSLNILFVVVHSSSLTSVFVQSQE